MWQTLPKWLNCCIVRRTRCMPTPAIPRSISAMSMPGVTLSGRSPSGAAATWRYPNDAWSTRASDASSEPRRKPEPRLNIHFELSNDSSATWKPASAGWWKTPLNWPRCSCCRTCGWRENSWWVWASCACKAVKRAEKPERFSQKALIRRKSDKFQALLRPSGLGTEVARSFPNAGGIKTTPITIHKLINFMSAHMSQPARRDRSLPPFP